MKKIALLVGVLAALVGTEAHAETDSDNFNPQHSFRPNEFPWESGPIGFSVLGQEVSVNLTATAYHEVTIEMVGSTEYDFDAQALTFTGDADGGVMQNALGIEVTVIVTAPVLGTFEVGVYQIDETMDGTFSPYLLPGDDERPFGVEEAIGPNDLVETDFSVLGQQIDLDIDWLLNVPGIEYQSTRILLTDGEDSVIANEVGIYDAEDDALDLVLPDVVPGETSTMYGTLEGEFDAEVSLVFIINVTLNGETSIGPFEAPLDYPVNESIPVEFPVEVINFDVPAEPEPGTSTGDVDGTSTGEPSADSSGSDSDSDSDGTTTGIEPDPTTGGGDGSSGGLPAAPTPSDSGCGCTTTNDGSGFAWVLGLFGLTMLRRRRDE